MADESRIKMIEKIRTIQLKAEGTSSEAEANTFLEKMSKLMEENGISADELREKDLVHGFGHAIYSLKYGDAWRRQLMWAVSRLCGCVGIQLTGTKEHQMKIYGREENIDIAVETYVYIHDQVRLICRAMYPSDRKSYIQAQKGITFGICEKIRLIMETMLKENDEKLAAAGPTGTALVVPPVVEAKVVAEWVRRTTNTRPAKARAVTVTGAMLNGMNAAGRVDVRKVVKS